MVSTLAPLGDPQGGAHRVYDVTSPAARLATSLHKARCDARRACVTARYRGEREPNQGARYQKKCTRVMAALLKRNPLRPTLRAPPHDVTIMCRADTPAGGWGRGGALKQLDPWGRWEGG